ncbi:hypothetical protein APY30_10235 [Xanthomonas citri pv. malvacearum]|nr:hypothetical protein APY30_10235 [Xanthomonas citri pv. malvacearum]OOW99702.1 hypothetical protein Xmlv_21130 [Xanthomonas citri pv. malvacearum]
MLSFCSVVGGHLLMATESRGRFHGQRNTLPGLVGNGSIRPQTPGKGWGIACQGGNCYCIARAMPLQYCHHSSLVAPFSWATAWDEKTAETRFFHARRKLRVTIAKATAVYIDGYKGL